MSISMAMCHVAITGSMSGAMTICYDGVGVYVSVMGRRRGRAVAHRLKAVIWGVVQA